MVWLFVPGLACSMKGSEPHSSFLASNTAPCVTSRGKPMRPQRLLAAWRTVPWMQRLSGLTCDHSTADAGVDSWMSLLRASRVSPIPSPESAPELPMIDGCGLTSQTLFATFLLGSFFSKTSAASFPVAGSRRSSDRWPTSGTLWNGACYRRPALAQVTKGNACSYWATITASCSKRGSTGSMMVRCLNQEVVAWPTPTAADAEQLGSAAALHVTLHRATLTWPTPLANDGEKRGNLALDPRNGLAGATQLWATPQARDFKSGQTLTPLENSRPLSEQCLTFLPLGPTVNGGPRSSPPSPGGRRRLSPAFAAWLMGWPWWWTSSAPISCAPSAMALYRRKLRQLLCNCCGEPGTVVKPATVNPATVNPTRSVIARSAYGRPLGEGTKKSKLTDDIVRYMRLLHAKHGHSYNDLAKKFNVGHSTVRDVITYRTWIHVTD